ncbi:hypothetical protein GLOTRDRAFT_129258 [Gloeophyllum trabeum ATCC 11539]|uniref:DUF6534 domain-containing protein n=1 Tax=Gloeophyllum trabeum (strain ATCC 11539 / FP-39264 / Madison 617) TaxID=670483 RepID=S7Q9N7_GLOTA|nr:uncharacterized protein GLOTRDRAFT_129258 [Gloeophyllum trabeum ATCC 11539]EPQ56058.1 hypothetical protein GLOTRDRAFT_129258 [Gloeophyllum trabeum ATCC 11539]
MGNPLDATFALMLIAFFIDAVLYGAGMLLAFQYFTRYPEDPKSSKWIVGTMAFLMTVHICTYFAWGYFAFIQSFSSLTQIDIMPRTAVTQLLAIYIVAFISQMFFAWRIWRLSHRSVFLTGIPVLLGLLQLSAGIAQTTLSAEVGRFSLLASTEKVTTTQSAATAACDLSITVILITLFHTSRTGLKRTDTLLNKLIVYSLNRGVLTTLAAFFNMLFFVLFPDKFIFMLPLLPSGQLYLISVTTTLISRHTLSSESTRGHSTANASGFPLSAVPQNGGPPGGGVHITTSVLAWGPNDEELGETTIDQTATKKDRMEYAE